MMRIDKPLGEGLAKIIEATRQENLVTFPALLRFGGRLLRIAKYYDANSGDPNSIRASRISEEAKVALLYLYDNPPLLLAYIRQLRSSMAGEACPMCGGQNPTSLDHYLTKKKYPEFALLPFNLVPACSCNGQRGESLWDSVSGARLLHPYYDDCLKIPLINVDFDPQQNPPKLSVKYLLASSDKSFENLKFHVEKIILKTNFLIYVEKRWEKAKIMPDAILPGHRQHRLDNSVFNKYLCSLARSKEIAEGPNSWEAVLYRSMSQSHISDWLFSFGV